jgi:hypothetical protein
MLMSELPYQQALLSYRTFSEIVRSFLGLIHTFLCPNFELSLVFLDSGLYDNEVWECSEC